MTTTIRTDLISQTEIAFMRTMTLAFTVSGAKPNTKLYAFFDAIPVDSKITQTGGTLGVNVVTDGAGQATGTFFVDPMTYATGVKTLKFQDDPAFLNTTIPGSTTSSAQADFTSHGVLKTNRDTITDRVTQINVVTVENNIIDPPPVWTAPQSSGGDGGGDGGGGSDPLAQSFFTFGVTGGLSIAKIDVYVQNKPADGGVPLIMEIRELINGYPGPNLVSKLARTSIRPEDIATSNDASVPTSFVFDMPIFVPENKEYCFVLLANSDKYLVWTAKIGENAQETGQTIFEQPFIGSMFKSENNTTWTTDQTEDIKFRIHKAVFDTAGANVVFRAKAPKLLIYGRNMTVTSGSNIVRVRFDHLHGLRNGDKLRVLAPTGNSLYRGITAAQITGLYTITYVDEYNVTFQLASGTANSTGTLEISGIVNEIQVDAGGTGYTTPVLTINGANTTLATATATVVGGAITSVTVTNPGAGYTAKPTVSVTGGGSGASLFLISEAVFEIETNRVFDEVIPRVATVAPALTGLTSTMKVTTPEYAIQGAVGANNDAILVTENKSILVSTDNKAAFVPGQDTTQFTLNLASDSANVSPVVAISEAPALELHAYRINNQTEWETLTPAVVRGEGSLASVNINVGGTGYSSNVINISAPDLSTGVQATATANFTSTVVTSITITNAGSGYLKPPTVTMNQVVGSPATLIGTLTPFNTEVSATGGTAKARYVSKPISLETPSRGAVIFASAYSQALSAFDFYIRTSSRSSNVPHTSLPWKMMSCDVSRNMSTKPNEFLDYEFYINNLNPFDVYDLKIVLRSTDRRNIPILDNYRAIILAT